MAKPRVFVSSTYYDLKYIRENLKYFIKTIGYEPVLSEDGDVFYNPKNHTHDSCLTEVPACQIFILIIGGRFGGQYINGKKSITNMEYEIAIKEKVPVFALVEIAILGEHKVYSDNVKNNKKVKAEEICYPSVDNVKIFEFIDEVRKHTVNNAIVPFRDFTDIETYLKKQWAGMMFSFLNDKIQENRVANTLEEISKVNQKIEVLTTQILKSVGKDLQFVTVLLYESMIGNESYRAMTHFRDEKKSAYVKTNPIDFLKSNSFDELAKNLGVNLKIVDSDFTVSSSGEIDSYYYKQCVKNYEIIKEDFNRILNENNLTIEKYIKEMN
ncbi:DUF4062 domain-containing protein [Cytophagaceae bacterium 50C-KIRBA]|uniref:DUF4062 domain-containing protein n=1 Tax=Aquirufa beregesia TaxID=2516556 RepID=A0ABX0EWU4_9BACT|nr:DUF4062 domain-containing protein [Aquirufa beregesia]NGZ44914.1 DUF4062 domain-containing protein [Aquirufa beregesia]